MLITRFSASAMLVCSFAGDSGFQNAIKVVDNCPQLVITYTPPWGAAKVIVIAFQPEENTLENKVEKALAMITPKS